MNMRTTLYMFGGLVGILALFFTFQYFDVKTTSEAKEHDKWLLPTLKANTGKGGIAPRDFASLIIERPTPDSDKKDGSRAATQKLEFQRKGNEWRMVSPRNCRADSSAVDRLIDQLLRVERTKESPKGDLASFGLDKPATQVTLTLNDEKVKEAKLANKEFTVAISAPKEALLYVTSSDLKKAAAAINKSRIDNLFKPVDDFRSKELLTSMLDVNNVRVAGTGRKPLELEQADGRDWLFKEPKYGIADNTAVNDLTTAIGNIKVEKAEDFVADGPFDAAKLAQYGLEPDKATYSVVIKHKKADAGEPTTETLLIGAKDAQGETRAMAVMGAAMVAENLPLFPSILPSLAPYGAERVRSKQSEDGGAYFAKLANEDTIVRIPAKQLKALEKNPDDMRGKGLARIDGTKVDAINITAAGETLRFRRHQLKTSDATMPAPSAWDLYTDNKAHVKTHLDTVTKMIDAINKVQVTDARGFLDDDAKQRAWFGMEAIDLGLDKPQAEVAVWHDGIKRDKDGKPEGKDEPQLKDDAKTKPNLRLVLGRKDDKRNCVYVKRQIDDGPAVILAIPDPYLSGGATPPPPRNQFGGPPPEERESISITSKVTGGFLAFRDHVLPSFKSNEATKVTYTRGTETYEADKDQKINEQGTPISTWNLKKPVVGKAQDLAWLLSTLSRLSADKLVSDRATERDRKEKFGLGDKPLLTIAVKTADKDKKEATYTYFVGKKAEGDKADGYYARIDVKPAEGNAPEANDFVFLVSKDTLRSLDVELRDTMIFAREESAKPQELTLTWRDKAKNFQETKLELAYLPEKEGSDKKVWTVKSLTVDGKDAKASLPKLDTAKVDQLVGTAPGFRFGGPQLNPLITERFLIHDGKPDARARLDAASKDNPPALVLTLKLDNQPARTLTIGDRWETKEDEYPGLRDKVYYQATASTVPNAVFLLGEMDFKDLVSGVDYFKAAEKTALK